MTSFTDAGQAKINDTAQAREFDEQAGRRGGNATRHLRAAAHLDPAFRAAVISELVENRHRIPAPSPGVDSALVLEECLIARRWAVTAATFDLTIGVVALLVSGWAVLSALGMLTALAIVISVIRGVTSSLRSNSDSATAYLKRSVAALVVGAVIVGLVVIFLLRHIETRDGGFDVTTLILGALLIIGLWAVVGAALIYQQQNRLAVLASSPGGGDGDAPERSFPHLEEVFKRLRARGSEAETVYGGFNAFVGSGLEEREEKWSFAVELRPSARRGPEDAPPGPISTPELHDKIYLGLADLGEGHLYPGDLLRRISVRDRLFRSGLHDRAPEHWHGRFSAIDPDTRRLTLTRGEADRLDLISHERLRHYIEARAELWEQQVVASVFLRIHVQGHLLQMEGLPFVLPPVKAQYRSVDQIPPPDPAADAISAACSAVVRMPADLLAALTEPLIMLVSAYRSWSRRRWYRRMLEAGFPVDYGPNSSLRELSAEITYQQRFQEIDVYRFFSSVRKRVATVVLETLREHGFDTAEFEQFIQSININSGIQNYNSLVTAPQAAGIGAKAGKGKADNA